MRLWVDGVEKGNVTGAGLGTSDQQWNLGQNSHFFPSGSYRNFAGRIDEPIIASRAYTQPEIGTYTAVPGNGAQYGSGNHNAVIC